jgi:formate dehydrogenase
MQEVKTNSEIILGTPEDLKVRIKKRAKLKGRQADEHSIEEVKVLISEFSRRDLLIEHLHVLNDTYNGLHERHLTALGKLMNISMAEVFEVATFYHHFEVLNGDKNNSTITVRVCNSISCEIAGANNLLEKLPSILGNQDVKVVPVPCVGRCEHAPVAVVHQHPVIKASVEQIKSLVDMRLIHHPRSNDLGQFEPADFAEKSVTTTLDVNISPSYCGLNTYQV